jgi:hypothetical protein
MITTSVRAASGLLAADGPRAAAGAHARMLAVFIATALLFMLGPGTYLGVWNLVETSTRQSVSLVSPAWLQAHGHAQVFGWVATFILGIGLYSVPVVRPGATRSLTAGWAESSDHASRSTRARRPGLTDLHPARVPSLCSNKAHVAEQQSVDRVDAALRAVPRGPRLFGLEGAQR